jgi:peptide/nickel transport system substrate-binding protein
MTIKNRWLDDPDFQRLAEQNARRLGLSRRDFLKVIAASGGLTLTIACGSSPSNKNSQTTVRSTSASGNATAGAGNAAPSAAASSAVQPVQGGALTVALATEPPSGGLDANVTNWAVTHRIVENINDTLVTETSDFQFKPALATSWEISPDGKIYTFKLRTDVKFHDGTPFNADAVKFNCDRIKDPKTASLYAATLLSSLDTVDVPDQSTVRLTFKDPYPLFFNYASQAFLGMVSPAGVQKYGTDFANHPVGSGPFIFKEWAKQDHITLTRNPDYQWGSPSYAHSGPAYVDTLTFKIIPETSIRTAALAAGEADIIETVPPADVEKMKGNKDLFVASAVSPGIPFVLQFNESKPPFDDIAARQAFLYGIDRDAMIKAFFLGLYPKADAPLSPTTFGYDKSVEGMYKYDPSKAKQLLDTAGWKPGSDGIRVNNGNRFTVVYLEADVDREQRHAIAESIQEQAKDLGAEVKIQYLAGGPQLQAIKNGDYNISGASSVNSDADILATSFNSRNAPSVGSTSRLKSQQLDQWLDQGAQETDRAKRMQIYSQVQQYLMQNAVLLPIYVFPYIMGARSAVHGLNFDVRAYPIFYDIFLRK